MAPDDDSGLEAFIDDSDPLDPEAQARLDAFLEGILREPHTPEERG